jgi:hypothetical protein
MGLKRMEYDNTSAIGLNFYQYPNLGQDNLNTRCPVLVPVPESMSVSLSVSAFMFMEREYEHEGKIF